MALTLHNFDVDHFLEHHWQKAPLLIRGALPGFTGFLSLDDLAELCPSEQTPSRFFSPSAGIVHGPLELDPEGMAARDWTLLVQSVETVSDEGWALLDAFSFLPRARLDDLMVSYAAPGGGIGPHFDLYDVFLVQGFGQRRWRYGAKPLDAALDEQASGPFDFEAEHDEVLEAGDVLYLPPRVPHDGEAVTACTTYSVGGAAPRHADLAGEFLAFLSTEPELAGINTNGMLTDPSPPRPRRRARLPDRLTSDTLGLFAELAIDRTTVSTFLGRLLSAPKPHTGFPDGEELAPEELAAGLKQTGRLQLTPPSRMLHDGEHQIFVNGSAFVFDEGDAEALFQLADERHLALPCSLSDEACGALLEWIAEGFVHWRAGPADD